MEYLNKENLLVKAEIKSEQISMQMLTCDPCNLRFGSEAEYILHVKMSHMLAIKPEPVFEEIQEVPPVTQFNPFGAFHEYLQNDNVLTLNKPYRKIRECPGCNVGFCKEDIIKTHMCITEQGTKHRCNICWKPFAHKGNAENHINVKHTNRKVEKKYKCSTCSKEYALQYTLDEHVRVVHQKFRYKCTDCLNEYSSRATLDVHVKSKHRGLKFNCQQCDSTFSYKHEYVQHVRAKHEGVSYQCTQCFDTFIYKQSLKNHVKSKHEKIKDLKCEFCDMTFSLYSSLYMHKKRKHEVEWNSEKAVSGTSIAPMMSLNSNASPAPFVAKENPTASVPQKTVPLSFPMTPMTLPMSVANHLMAAAALNVPFQTVSNQESASIPMVPLGSINSM